MLEIKHDARGGDGLNNLHRVLFDKLVEHLQFLLSEIDEDGVLQMKDYPIDVTAPKIKIEKDSDTESDAHDRHLG